MMANSITITILLLLLLLFAAFPMAVASQARRVINVNNPGPDDRVDILQLRHGDDGGGPMRNALKSNANNRWTKYRAGKSKYRIPYVISGSFSQTERKTIRKAMHSIDRNTCVRFKRRRRESDYVDIQNQGGQGCYTMVGMVRGHNLVMLESSPGATCITYVTVLHELMHKVGLWHEQMRYDRDKFIKVHWENIPGNLRPQFEKVPSSVSSVYGVRYDYRSAMHYTKSAFASSADKVTMETRERRFQNVIGTVQKASRGDWTKICAMYKCGRCMRKTFHRRRSRKRRRRGGKKSKAESMWLGRDTPVQLVPNNGTMDGMVMPTKQENNTIEERPPPSLVDSLEEEEIGSEEEKMDEEDEEDEIEEKVDEDEEEDVEEEDEEEEMEENEKDVEEEDEQGEIEEEEIGESQEEVLERSEINSFDANRKNVLLSNSSGNNNNKL